MLHGIALDIISVSDWLTSCRGFTTFTAGELCARARAG